MKDIAKATGEFLKAVISVMLFGKTPPDDKHPHEKASD